MNVKSTPSLSPQDRERFPKLEIRKCVARAGYSCVWTATNTLENDTIGYYVLKVSRKKKKQNATAANDESLERFDRAFSREVSAYKRLSGTTNSKYFVRLEAVISLQNNILPALLLECFTSSTQLSKIIERKKYCLHTKLLFKTIVNAVASIHACGIVHHDLKPDNILIRHHNVDGDDNNAMVVRNNEIELKIIDFGMAQPFSQDLCCAPCGGTPAYSAPEVLWATKHCSSYVDQWSLGAIFFELLTQKQLVYGQSLNEYRYASLHVDFKTDNAHSKMIEDQNALELLGALMQQIPADRISLEKVKENKYFL